jgi:excisionase family DNA binding protein
MSIVSGTVEPKRMKQLLTPKQVAQAIGVSEASLKRWCDKGLIAATRTEGGHRRLALGDVIEFLRRTGRSVVTPELLCMPPARSLGERSSKRSQSEFVDALVQGDEARIHHILFDLYLAKHSICEIGDRIISESFHQIGEKWECREVEPYQERRACEIVERVLRQVRAAMPPAPTTAPLAIGGTLEGDIYRLPTALVELVLRECGWRSESLGTNLPAATLCAAIEQLQPRLFWLSVSHIVSVPQFRQQVATIYEAARQRNILLAVGGRALEPAIRREMHYSVYCDLLRHLASFVASHPRV